MSFYLGGTEITSQPYFGSSLISKIYKGTTTVWEYVASGSADAYFDDVSLLLHMDGANGSTTFTDDSSNALTVTANSTAQISTAQSKFGGASGLFNGTSDAITISDPSSLCAPGSGDFTLEAWVYNVGGAVTPVVWTKPSIGKITLYGSNAGAADEAIFGQTGYQTGATSRVTSSISISQSTWTHVALTRSGSTIELWIGGNSAGSFTDSSDFSKSINMIGAVATGTTPDFYFWDGYIDEVRITPGVARYTTSFTPPTAAFPNSGSAGTDPDFSDVSLLLHMDGADGGTTFTDDSNAAATITPNANNPSFLPTTTTSVVKFGSASAQFNDGDTTTLSTPSSSSLQLQDSDFTVECWVNFGSSPEVNWGIFKKDSFYLGGNTNRWVCKTADGTGNAFVINWTPSASTWYHVALTNSSGTVTLYIDGTSIGSGTFGTTTPGTGDFEIGVGVQYLTGYIDDFRVTKGVVRYTSNFTPPTTAFPNS